MLSKSQVVSTGRSSGVINQHREQTIKTGDARLSKKSEFITCNYERRWPIGRVVPSVKLDDWKTPVKIIIL